MAIPLSYNIATCSGARVHADHRGRHRATVIFIGALALAEGFHAALVETGSTRSCCARAPTASCRAASRAMPNIIRAHPAVAAGPDGRPLVSADLRS
jgi:hypothetical protein